jgi:hypothetical protein
MDTPAGSDGRPARDPFATFRRRLVARFSTAAWLVLVVKVVAAQSQADGRRVPDHWLAAAWTPLDDGPTRWPEAVVIGSPAADNAIAELCTRLPDDARLHLVDPDAVDAVLAAQILLAADRNLEPYHRNGLTAFIAAERTRIAARVASGYTDQDPRFAAFRDALTSPVRGRRPMDDESPR